MKRVLLLAVCVLICLSGCGTQKKDSENEPVLYSAVEDKEIKSEIESTVNAYLNALQNKSYSQLMSCTEGSFGIAGDETAFEGLTMGLEETKLEFIDLDDIHKDNGSYFVKVRYSLVFTGSYIDEQGIQREAGTADHFELFTLTERNEGLVITDISITGEG